MLLLKSFHIIFMVTWFAGLFYLPRLFVYHAACHDDEDDKASNERFKVMERKLYYGIMMPGAILTILSGGWMMFDYAWQSYAATSSWLQWKLGLILVLVVYHIYCGKYVRDFRHDNNRYSHVFYRWFNEFPVFILLAVVILAVTKPF